jgi:tetratricopeptide (TPR) repeat protein
MKGSVLSRLPISLFAAALLPAAALAQLPPLTLPQPSPEATVTQQIGLTDITISYHRPAVNKRTVWGDLVPYDQVWRAGANENTTVTFTSPVTVEGRPLAAGTYGVHMIPTKAQWTVIFSKVSSAWGSFSYDEREDALRVAVTPVEAPFQERLGYTFDDPTGTSVAIVMRWEKLAVPIRVEVDTPSVVVDSLRSELRGLPRFGWQGWNQAAAYCLQADVNLDEAITWADRSIQANENFTNLRTRAGLAEKKGDTAMAASLRNKAMGIATEADINAYGYQLLGQQKVDEAIAMFQKNVRDYPKSWNTYDSLGEAYDIKGEKKLAADNYKKALAMVQDQDNKKRIDGILKRLASQG